MKLKLPWPPKQLNPNFKRRNHWRKYYKHTKAARLLACALAKPHKPESFNFTVTFHKPPACRLDRDNIEASCKAYWDGFADAWGVNDKEFTFNYVHGEPRKGGAVIVEVVK